MSREIQKNSVKPALFAMLGIHLFLAVSESSAIDSPHNSNNMPVIACATCHDPALSAATPTWWTDQEANVCGACHGPAGTAKNVFTHKTGTVVLVQCAQCHNPHNQQQNRTWTTESYLYTGVSTSVTATTLTTAATWTADRWKDHLLIPNTRYQSFNYRIAGNTANTITIVNKGIAPDNAIRLNYAPAGSTFAIAYGKLVKENVNGRNVKFFRQTGTNSFADNDATTDGICQVCHTQTTSFKADGTLEGLNHPGNSAGIKCSACHTHVIGFKRSDRCLDCHSISLGGRAAITPQFAASSHHVQGTTLTDAHCYQCHWEANNDGSVNETYHGGWTTPSPVDLVIYQAGTRPETYSSSTATQYTPNGTRTEKEKINSHCLGCHSDQNNTTQPFGDGRTPKQYSWDGTSIAARYSQAGTTPWGKYSGANVTPKNTVTKAYSAHGNAVNNQGGWNLTETWPNTRNGSVNVLCFDCHNAHGSTVEGRTTSYNPSATANGGILKDTTAGLGGYAMTYKPQAGGSADDKNLRNAGASLCFDCHLTATAGSTPWGYSGTFGATQQILAYWDSPYFASGSAGPQQRFAYKASNVNKGGHFGASSQLSSTPSGTINGLCTPCHDPHGVSPTLGVNQQYGVPLLKGTWLTSPYKEDTAPANNTPGTVRDNTYPLGWDLTPREGVQYHIDQNTFGTNIHASVSGITQSDTLFAGLCLSCHPKSSLTNGINGGTWKSVDRIHESVKGWGANVRHKYTCSKCHTPHNGSALPRLMVTNCLDKKHKGRVQFNPAPVLSGSGSCDDLNCYGLASTLGFGWKFPQWSFVFGSGGGSFPGGWGGSYPNAYLGNYAISCHENNSADQSWNQKTGW